VRRRDLIALVGVAAVARPDSPVARADESVPVVGIFLPNPTTADARLQIFMRELAALGWREGETIRIERRFFASGTLPDPAKIAALAAELIALKPDVIWTLSPPAVSALERTTHTVPIVFMNVGDPVASGFAASIARPGGNATGFSVAEPSIGGKWVDILRDIAPEVRHIGMLHEPDTLDGGVRENLLAAAASLHVPAATFAIHNPADIKAVTTQVAGAPGGGLIVAPSNTTAIYRQRIIELAAADRLPAIYGYEFYARDGGLVAYGADLLLQAKGCAVYVDKILRGEKAAELPIQFPTRYKLVVNLITAKALGLTVPHSMLQRADEVIE
jgi:putative ABC transport system substrate-binding protein